MSTVHGGRQGPPQAERAAPARPLTTDTHPDSRDPSSPRSTPGPRMLELDVLRGLAIVFMMVDHVALLSTLPDLFRVVPGRLAMPLFFIIAGHLVTRLTWRHAGIAAIGLTLPVVVPWLDNPNVLVWYVVGAALIVSLRNLGVPPWLVAAAALLAHANEWHGDLPTSYEGLALAGLMALGAALPRGTFAAWARLRPARVRDVLATIGRRPLTWYVGHLLVLQALEAWAS